MSVDSSNSVTDQLPASTAPARLFPKAKGPLLKSGLPKSSLHSAKSFGGKKLFSKHPASSKSFTQNDLQKSMQDESLQNKSTQLESTSSPRGDSVDKREEGGTMYVVQKTSLPSSCTNTKPSLIASALPRRLPVCPPAKLRPSSPSESDPIEQKAISSSQSEIDQLPSEIDPIELSLLNMSAKNKEVLTSTEEQSSVMDHNVLDDSVFQSLQNETSAGPLETQLQSQTVFFTGQTTPSSPEITNLSLTSKSALLFPPSIALTPGLPLTGSPKSQISSTESLARSMIPESPLIVASSTKKRAPSNYLLVSSTTPHDSTVVAHQPLLNDILQWKTTSTSVSSSETSIECPDTPIQLSARNLSEQNSTSSFELLTASTERLDCLPYEENVSIGPEIMEKNSVNKTLLQIESPTTSTGAEFKSNQNILQSIDSEKSNSNTEVLSYSGNDSGVVEQIEVDYKEKEESEELSPHVTLCTSPSVLMSRDRSGVVSVFSSNFKQQGSLGAFALSPGSRTSELIEKSSRSKSSNLASRTSSVSSILTSQTSVSESGAAGSGHLGSSSVESPEVGSSCTEEVAVPSDCSVSPSSSDGHNCSVAMSQTIGTGPDSSSPPLDFLPMEGENGAVQVSMGSENSTELKVELLEVLVEEIEFLTAKSEMDEEFEPSDNTEESNPPGGYSRQTSDVSVDSHLVMYVSAMADSSLVQQVTHLLEQCTDGFTPSVHTQSSLSSMIDNLKDDMNDDVKNDMKDDDVKERQSLIDTSPSLSTDSVGAHSPLQSVIFDIEKSNGESNSQRIGKCTLLPEFIAVKCSNLRPPITVVDGSTEHAGSYSGPLQVSKTESASILFNITSSTVSFNFGPSQPLSVEMSSDCSSAIKLARETSEKTSEKAFEKVSEELRVAQEELLEAALRGEKVTFTEADINETITEVNDAVVEVVPRDDSQDYHSFSGFSFTRVTSATIDSVEDLASSNSFCQSRQMKKTSSKISQNSKHSHAESKSNEPQSSTSGSEKSRSQKSQSARSGRGTFRNDDELDQLPKSVFIGSDHAPVLSAAARVIEKMCGKDSVLSEALYESSGDFENMVVGSAEKKRHEGSRTQTVKKGSMETDIISISIESGVKRALIGDSKRESRAESGSIASSYPRYPSLKSQDVKASTINEFDEEIQFPTIPTSRAVPTAIYQPTIAIKPSGSFSSSPNNHHSIPTSPLGMITSARARTASSYSINNATSTGFQSSRSPQAGNTVEISKVMHTSTPFNASISCNTSFNVCPAQKLSIRWTTRPDGFSEVERISEAQRISPSHLNYVNLAPPEISKKLQSGRLLTRITTDISEVDSTMKKTPATMYKSEPLRKCNPMSSPAPINASSATESPVTPINESQRHMPTAAIIPPIIETPMKSYLILDDIQSDSEVMIDRGGQNFTHDSATMITREQRSRHKVHRDVRPASIDSSSHTDLSPHSIRPHKRIGDKKSRRAVVVEERVVFHRINDVTECAVCSPSHSDSNKKGLNRARTGREVASSAKERKQTKRRDGSIRHRLHREGHRRGDPEHIRSEADRCPRHQRRSSAPRWGHDQMDQVVEKLQRQKELDALDVKTLDSAPYFCPCC